MDDRVNELVIAVYRHNGLLNERLLPDGLRGVITAAERAGVIDADELDNEGWRVLRLTESGRKMVDGEEEV